ncbi:ATP-dependent DNA ligase [Kitasatospora sp. NPDC054795]
MLPFALPVDVALARPVTAFPSSDGLSLEPKWDGWRAVLRTGPSPGVFSRHGTDLTRAMADVAHRAGRMPDAVLDGELLAVTDDGRVSFGLLQSRAGKRPRPGAGFSVVFVAFDLLATGANGTDLRRLPYRERREQLVSLLGEAPAGIRPTPATGDEQGALAWVGALGGGIEGVVAKPVEGLYLPRYGSGWTKWRRQHTTDAVITGITAAADPGRQAAVLSRPDAEGRLRPVGVSLPLPSGLRRELVPLLRPAGDRLAELPGTVGGLPGSPPITYLPVVPEVVVEIVTDQERPEFGRYRHRPRIVRRRTNLTPDLLLPA